MALATSNSIGQSTLTAQVQLRLLRSISRSILGARTGSRRITSTSSAGQAPQPRRTTSTSPSPTTSSTAPPRKITTTTSAHHAGKSAAGAAPKSKSNPKSKNKSVSNSNPHTLGLSIGLRLGASILLIGGIFAFYAIKESGYVQRIIERRRQLAEDKKNAVPVWCPDDEPSVGELEYRPNARRLNYQETSTQEEGDFGSDGVP
ncbi:hypothetical protein IWX90DRAFT_159286 [Phyllosticta citrichinensis]|uniref:Uncharacterized protein n=1 Tax=Phyllosticta citrichinensis TaxID=1130410 RepID=A0ABR1Y074_9PEZI